MRQVLKSISSYPVAPFLFAISFVFTLYNHNIGELHFNVLFWPILLVSLLFTCLPLIFFKLFKNTIGINVFFSIFTILFFTFNDAVTLMSNTYFRIDSYVIDKNILTEFIWILLLILTIFLIIRFNKYMHIINKYLFIVGCVVLIVPTTQIIWYEIVNRAHTIVLNPIKTPKINLTQAEKKQLPDIYYIVPDSYAAPEIFSKYFGFDNSEFINKLTQKGFYVAEKATSNYPKTYASITSTLNMEYLDFLSIHTNSSDITVIDPYIKNGIVLQFLKSLGYKYYQLGSWWGPTQYNPNATKNFNLDLQNPLGLNGFQFMLIQSTMIDPIFNNFFPQSVVTDSVEDKRRRILYQFETLPKVAKLAGPKFVFTHILAPHGPNVFGKNCEFITQESLYGRPDEESYVNQVSCINLKLEQTIDLILNNSSRPPIIYIQSDEGAAFLADQLTPSNNWKSAGKTMLKKKFPVLSAYYFPNVTQSKLYPEITPVNAFRVIFNQYFKTNLPLLPDKNYILPDLDHLYDFVDITDKLK
jgi:hypothetical protein